MAEREGEEVALVGLRLVLDHRLDDGGDEVAMGEHRALGEPGGAARVDQPGGVVLVDLDRRLRSSRRPPPVVRSRRIAPSPPLAADRPRRARSTGPRPAPGWICSRNVSLDDEDHARRRCRGSTPTPSGGGGSSGRSAPSRRPARRSSTRRTRRRSGTGSRRGHPARPAPSRALASRVAFSWSSAVGDLPLAVDERGPVGLPAGVQGDDVPEQHGLPPFRRDDCRPSTTQT